MVCDSHVILNSSILEDSDVRPHLRVLKRRKNLNEEKTPNSENSYSLNATFTMEEGTGGQVA